jgi:addiction module HigA family antidote
MRSLLVPAKKRPPHPGEVIRELYMEPLGLTCRSLAEAMEISYVRLNEILNGRRGVTPDTAMRLARVFETSDALWLNMQTVLDLFDARHSPEAKKIAKLRPIAKHVA